jgi:SAM-dependent methyltransferase
LTTPPPAAAGSLAARIRRVLLECEFLETRIRSVLGSVDPDTPLEDCLAQWRWRCRGGDPLSILIRLFILGMRVPGRAVHNAVAPMRPSEWQEAGLLGADGDHFSATVELQAQPGFFVASDAGFRRNRPAAGHVLGVTSSTLTLNRCAIRRDARRSLDLGTGNGFLALHLAAHSLHVTAADINPRALAFARFNAALNGISDVEFCESDRFARVPQQPFDLVLGNLPFVLSPSHDLFYRDGGNTGGTLFERILRDTPARLADGGFAQFLGQWTGAAEDLVPPDCDAWVVRFATDSAEEHATRWLLPSRVQGERARAGQYRAWMRYYEKQRITAIHTGLWCLRKRSSGRCWLVETARPLPAVSWGDRFLQVFRSWGEWRELPSAQHRWNVRLKVSPHTILREQSQWGPNAGSMALLLSSDGFSAPVDVDALTRAALLLADGTPTLAEIAAQAPGTASPALMAAAEQMLLHGYLELA